MQSNPTHPPQKLRRNPKRGRIAGLCSGLAEHLGIDVFWVRLAVVLSVFISFSTTFWIYLILWLVVPPRTETPMPDVALGLWWKLRKIDRQLARAHRKLPPDQADELQEVFDLIKVLAPHFEDSRLVTARREPIQIVALQRFPALLRQFMVLPRHPGRPQTADTRTDYPVSGLEERLVYELNVLRQELRSALDLTLDWVARDDADEAGTTSREVEQWREQLMPLKGRLTERAGVATLTLLQNLEDQLVFLLDRSSDASVFDLDVLEVRKIAYEYLPDALDQYLRLPPDMARGQILPSGKTAEQALNEQLGLLTARLQDQARVVFEAEARGLMVHGRFLHEKFAEPSEVGRLDDVETGRR